MDFNQMLETWQAQNTAPPYDVNRDALQQALQSEHSKVLQSRRLERRVVWFLWIFETGMAVWAGLWIAITITNGWPAIYAITAGLSFVMFALGVGAFWMSRGRLAEPDRNFGNTLTAEVRRSLALVDYQLSVTRRWIFSALGIASIVVGTGLFSWTIVRSQNIPVSLSGGGWFWFTLVFVVIPVWSSYRAFDETWKAKPKLEFRQRRLRELLAALEARE